MSLNEDFLSAVTSLPWQADHQSCSASPHEGVDPSQFVLTIQESHMLKAIFLPLAQAELNDAIAWYHEQAGGLGHDFLLELDRAVRRTLTLDAGLK